MVQNMFRSTHVVEQHMFSMSLSILAFNFIYLKGIFFGKKQAILMILFSFFYQFPSLLIFDFDLIFVLFFTFLDPNGIFLGSMWGSKTVLGSTNVVEQLSFSMFPSILTFYFDLILGHF